MAALQEDDPLSKDHLTIAVGANDRTLPLMAGLIPFTGTSTGAQATYVTAPLETIFATAFDAATYDVSELSFSNYLYLTSIGECPYVGLPIFPSRSFRHSAIYIRDDRGIKGPRDLAGRLVGVREFTMTAALVARGMIEDEFGVRSQDIRWCYGRADRKDDIPIARVLPRDVEISKIDDSDCLSDMLVDGRIDAMIAYKPPQAYIDGAPNVRRLFEDWPAIERDYYHRTRHFPIMHLVGIRRDRLEQDPTLHSACARPLTSSMRYSATVCLKPSRPTRCCHGTRMSRHGCARHSIRRCGEMGFRKTSTPFVRCAATLSCKGLLNASFRQKNCSHLLRTRGSLPPTLDDRMGTE